MGKAILWRERATRPGHFCLSESNFLGSKWLFKPSYLKEYHAPQGQISGKITQLHGINYDKAFSPVGKPVTIGTVLSERIRWDTRGPQSDHSADPLTYIAILADPGVAWLFCKISLSVRRVDQRCVQLDSLVSPFVCFVCSFGFLVARFCFWFEDWISGQPVLERRHSKKQLPMVWDGPLLMNKITRKKVISPLRGQINLFFKREWFSSVNNWAIRVRHHPSLASTHPFGLGSVGCRSFKQERNIKKK